MLRVLATVLTILGLPAAGLAQSIDGRFGLAVPGGSQAAFLYADATAQLPFGSSGFGLEVGVLGRWSEDLNRHETYGAVTWTGTPGRLSLGVVQPAYDRVAVSPLERILPPVAMTERLVSATRSRVTWGGIYDSEVPLGVAWESGSGSLTWAVSAHRVRELSLNLVSAGIRWDAAEWSVAAAVEVTSDGESGGKLSAERQFGDITVGVAGYAAPREGGLDLGEGFLSWQASERFAVSALVQVPSGARDGDTLAVLAAEYTFRSGARIAAGVSAEDGEAVASLGLDMSF